MGEGERKIERDDGGGGGKGGGERERERVVAAKCTYLKRYFKQDVHWSSFLLLFV